jgi:phenylpyruvate tautomerase PptA (4-oxalocrotonate tautomerase family)
MPVAFLDIQSGLPTTAKQALVKEVSASIHEAYPIPDTRVYLREWSPEQVSLDGQLGRQVRPICHFLVPPGLPAEAKRRLLQRVSTAIADAYNLRSEDVVLPSGKRVNTRWVLSFFNEYSLDQVALDELPASENPMVLESLPALRVATPPST